MSRIRATSIAVAVVAALGLSACWPAPGQNPDRTAANGLESELNTASVLRLTEVWDTAVGPGPVGPPVVAGGGIAVRPSVHCGLDPPNPTRAAKPPVTHVPVARSYSPNDTPTGVSEP